MGEQNIKIYYCESYRDFCRCENYHIIMPDRLPVRISVRGVRVLINVGEFVILPAGTVFSLESSSKRIEMDFDFSFIEGNPEFTFLLPLLSLPYIYRQERQKDRQQEYAFGRILPIVAKKEKALPQTDTAVSPCELLKTLASGAEKKTDFYNTAAGIFLSAVYCLIGEEMKGALLEKEKNREKDMAAKFTKAIVFINEKFRENISLNDIAEAAGYSETHLSHAFKEFYGISVYDYLTGLRVGCAVRLLREGSASMQEVGAASGFASSSTFNRVFRNETGFSPREYLKLEMI